MKYEYFIVENGVEKSKIFCSSEPTLSYISTAEIKMTFSGNFLSEKIDTINNLLRIYAKQDKKIYKLGDYVFSDIQENATGKVKTMQINCYDLTYFCKISSIEERLYIAQGVKYTDAIESLLVECGIIDYFIEANNAIFQVTREGWEPGTNRLKIINQLLAEINYNSLFMGTNGVIYCTKYKQPTVENITKAYNADAYSILYPEHTAVIDTFERHNVFKAIVERSDGKYLLAMSINDSPISKISTVNQRRRVVSYEKLSEIANQKELQEYVDNKKLRSLYTYQTVDFSTGFTIHGANEIYSLYKGELQGIYEELEWSLTLSAAGKMTHKARKIEII